MSHLYSPVSCCKPTVTRDKVKALTEAQLQMIRTFEGADKDLMGNLDATNEQTKSVGLGSRLCKRADRLVGAGIWTEERLRGSY